MKAMINCDECAPISTPADRQAAAEGLNALEGDMNVDQASVAAAQRELNFFRGVSVGVYWTNAEIMATAYKYAADKGSSDAATYGYYVFGAFGAGEVGLAWRSLAPAVRDEIIGLGFDVLVEISDPSGQLDGPRNRPGIDVPRRRVPITRMIDR